MALRVWEEDAAAICAEIRARPTALKIVLKTKNEPLLLRGMVEHHLAITGPEGLIICDNGSTDESVVRYLDEISATVTVCRFGAFHNSLHYSGYDFAPLYIALKDSCSYYTVLDTDERLYWFEPDGTYRSDRSVAERVVASGQQAVPGTWAVNFPGQERVVQFSPSERWRLIRSIKNGKVILSSEIPVPELVGHNWQAPPELFEGGEVGNAVVVHLKHLSAQQRIAANLEKLSSYSRCHGLLEDVGLTGDVTLEDVLTADTEKMIYTARQYVDEIRKLLRVEQRGLTEGDASDGVPQLRLEDGELVFATPRERRRTLRFLRNPAALLAEALIPADGLAQPA